MWFRELNSDQVASVKFVEGAMKGNTSLNGYVSNLMRESLVTEDLPAEVFDFTESEAIAIKGLENLRKFLKGMH